MTTEKPLRAIKVPRGINLKNMRFGSVLEKHKKKIGLILSIASIGAAGAYVAIDILSPTTPRVKVAEFDPVSVVQTTPQEEAPIPVVPGEPQPGTGAADQAAGQPVSTNPPPSLPGTAVLQGAGVAQPVATAPQDQLNGSAKPAATPKAQLPTLAEQFAALSERLSEQDDKIAQLQEETTRLKAQLGAGTRVKEVKKPASASSGNSFDIRRLNLISISAEHAVVKTSNGGALTIPPGKAFPGGVVFISYDPVSHVLKTTAGDFLVQS